MWNTHFWIVSLTSEEYRQKSWNVMNNNCCSLSGKGAILQRRNLINCSYFHLVYGNVHPGVSLFGAIRVSLSPEHETANSKDSFLGLPIQMSFTTAQKMTAHQWMSTLQNHFTNMMLWGCEMLCSIIEPTIWLLLSALSAAAPEDFPWCHKALNWLCTSHTCCFWSMEEWSKKLDLSTTNNHAPYVQKISVKHQ